MYIYAVHARARAHTHTHTHTHANIFEACHPPEPKANIRKE
jgi:hypothetical protein